jgi:hypothetical protein
VTLLGDVEADEQAHVLDHDAAATPDEMPLLFEEFTSPPPAREPGRTRRLDLREQRWILLQKSERVPVRDIATALGIPASTIFGFLQRVQRDPARILDCRFTVPRYGEDGQVTGWRCRYCGYVDLDARQAAKHVLRHVHGE